jgi:hypothetical protein
MRPGASTQQHVTEFEPVGAGITETQNAAPNAIVVSGVLTAPFPDVCDR